MACKALRRAISTRSSLSVANGMLSFPAVMAIVSHAMFLSANSGLVIGIVRGTIGHLI